MYLDLFHWVSLAKANTGHRDGTRFVETLEACVSAADEGRAVFPTSDSIYMEISKIGIHRQRRDLRRLVERVCAFHVVTSHVVVATHEVEGLLDHLVGASRDPVNSMNYLDPGVARAFGMVGGFGVRSIETGPDVTQDALMSHPAGPETFDQALATAELQLNRDALEGSKSELEEAELRSGGWNPRAGYEVAVRRAQQEKEQVARLDEHPEWRTGRIRDVVAAPEVGIEVRDILARGLHDRGVTLEDEFREPGSLTLLSTQWAASMCL